MRKIDLMGTLRTPDGGERISHVETWHQGYSEDICALCQVYPWKCPLTAGVIIDLQVRSECPITGGVLMGTPNIKGILMRRPDVKYAHESASLSHGWSDENTWCVPFVSGIPMKMTPYIRCHRQVRIPDMRAIISEKTDVIVYKCLRLKFQQFIHT